MGTLVLDSNVVIAFADPADALHDAAVGTIAAARAAEDTFLLPAVVLAEALVRPFRTSEKAGESTENALVAFFGPLRVVDRDIASTAARLRARHRALRLPDSLVIATGVVERATTMTYDRRLSGIDPSVRVLEP